MISFKPLIFAVMCIFTLSACESASVSPAVDYPVTAEYEDVFPKVAHSRNTNSDAANVAGAVVGVTLLVVLIVALRAYEPYCPYNSYYYRRVYC